MVSRQRTRADHPGACERDGKVTDRIRAGCHDRDGPVRSAAGHLAAFERGKKTGSDQRRLPLPDVPITATKRCSRRRAVRASTCSSRPKNRCASSLSKGEGRRTGWRRRASHDAFLAAVAASKNGRSDSGAKPASARTTMNSSLVYADFSSDAGAPTQTACARNGRLRPHPGAF